jgi:hypothetical protein
MMRAVAGPRARPRLDLRGDLLLIFSALEIAYGTGNILDARFGVVRGVGVLTHWLPMTFWGSLWIVAGTVGITTALLRPGLDRVGYAALMGPLLLWSTATAAAFLTGDYPQAWTSTTTWGLMAVALFQINRRCQHARGRRGRS